MLPYPGLVTMVLTFPFQVSGKPSTSSLHIHPVLNDSREFGDNKDSTLR